MSYNIYKTICTEFALKTILMSFLINITSYISSLSKNVFNTKLINQSEIANIICLNLSYLFLVYPANRKSTIMTAVDFCFLGMITICTISTILFIMALFTYQCKQEDEEEQKYQLKKKDLEEMCNDGIKIYTNMMNHIILRAKESVDIQSDQ